MNDLWFRVLVAWYRLTGSSDVQAEWKARRALKRPGEARDAVEASAARAADRRYNCVCGQLLTAEDKTCHKCGRRQYLPFGVRKAFRMLGIVVPAALPGTIIAAVSMVIGYAIQLRYGAGGFGSPSDFFETYELGSSIPPLLLGSQPWRGFTYTMLHGNLMHIAFNAIALMQVGPLVERAFGSARFTFCWVIGGVLAAVVPALLGSPNPIIGASGSVFALIGMALIWGHLVGTAQGRMVRDVMVRWTIYATVFGLLIGGVAHSAHFAGLGAGALFGWILPPPGRNPSRRRLSPFLAATGIVVALGSLAWAGSWYADGRPVPAEFGMGDRILLLEKQAERDGWDAVLPAEAIALFDEARRVRKAGHPPEDMARLEERWAEIKPKLDPARQYLVEQRIRKRLWPNGRPVDPRGGGG